MTKEKKNEMVKKVQDQLWRNGYSVKDVTNYTDYNLLVDNKIKVEVHEAAHNQKGNYWLLQIKKKSKTKKVDILAVVVRTEFEEDRIFYMSIKKNFKKLGVGDLKLTAKMLKDLFTTSIKETFNN